MVRTESGGTGGYTPVSRPVSNTTSVVGRQVAPSIPIETIDERIAAIEAKINALGAFRTNDGQLAYLTALRDNLRYIKEHGPQTFEQKEAKEIDMYDIANIVLDMSSFGSAIASVIPIPQVRAGGIIAGTASNSIRYAMRGDYKNASREIVRGSRSYRYEMGRNKGTLSTPQKASRRR